MTQPSSPLEKFLSYLKETTKSEVKLCDSVFDKKFASYRHCPYPDPKKDGRPCSTVRTWINVILHEGLSDKDRSILFPGRFDLGNNRSIDDRPAKLSDLLAEINCGLGTKKGAKDGGKTKKNLQTILNGIKETVGYDLSDSETAYPIGALKVIKRLYKISSRKPRLFGLIKAPQVTLKPTMEFSDTAVRRINEEDSLFVADLLSYLSIEIPDERLEAINTQLLTSSKLLECIARENEEMAIQIRLLSSGDNERTIAAYRNFSERIKAYRPESVSTRQVPLDEAFYTYLRTLEFQHFVGEYEQIVRKALIEDEISDISSEILHLCDRIGLVRMGETFPHAAVTSINEFADIVKKNSDSFRKIVKSAIGLYIRPDNIEEITNHASKILAMYSFHAFGEKDLSAVVISIPDCIAALCSVRYQQSKKTLHAPYVFGKRSEPEEPKERGSSPLRSFKRQESILTLQKYDYIPHGISQLMYLRFCNIHARMTGHSEMHKAWMEFQLARLQLYAQCLQSNDIDAIISSVSRFSDHCETFLKISTVPVLPGLLIEGINKWMSNDGN